MAESSKVVMDLLLLLQSFHVAFLLLHDWVPLGLLNDTGAQRKTDTYSKRLLTTLLTVLPFLLLFVYSLRAARSGTFSHSLLIWLWIGYGLLFLGELRAWWVPYFIRSEPERAVRYRRLFGRTHAFLPVRKGIQPNTLHVLLHASTLSTLLCLMRIR